MNRSSNSLRAFAVAGSGLAGFVDAIGFLETRGYFVSFMSGNSTQLGLGLVGASEVVVPALLIGGFVSGVTAGSLLGRRAGRRHVAAVFAALALLLAAAAGVGALGAAVAAMLLVAVAMGMENAAIEENGEVRIGLTYMTGNLVKLGQNLATALGGGPRWGFVAHLMLWLGLMAGAVAGAACHPRLGTDALWLAALAALALAATAWAVPERLRG